MSPSLDFEDFSQEAFRSRISSYDEITTGEVPGHLFRDVVQMVEDGSMSPRAAKWNQVDDVPPNVARDANHANATSFYEERQCIECSTSSYKFDRDVEICPSIHTHGEYHPINESRFFIYSNSTNGEYLCQRCIEQANDHIIHHRDMEATASAGSRFATIEAETPAFKTPYDLRELCSTLTIGSEFNTTRIWPDEMDVRSGQLIEAVREADDVGDVVLIDTSSAIYALQREVDDAVDEIHRMLDELDEDEESDDGDEQQTLGELFEHQD